MSLPWWFAIDPFYHIGGENSDLSPDRRGYLWAALCVTIMAFIPKKIWNPFFKWYLSANLVGALYSMHHMGVALRSFEMPEDYIPTEAEEKMAVYYARGLRLCPMICAVFTYAIVKAVDDLLQTLSEIFPREKEKSS
jgi:hypothetical protein